MTESFPRQLARTRQFTLGVPRAFHISPDGTRVTFLRTKSGDDPVTCLWEADAATGAERLVADPRALGAEEGNLPPEERARRERVRETAGGIVSYATDTALSIAVFALSGQVYAVRLGGAAAGGAQAGGAAAGGAEVAGAAAGGAQAGAQKGGVSAGNGPWLVPTRTPALEPRPDPGGRRVAYVHDGTLRVAGLGETGEPPGGELADHEPADHEVADHEVAGEPGVTYGLAEFVAAEEMERTRGYWWSPDGARLLIARVDESPVRRWYIADPANPGRPPAEVAYPAAGTPNADVSLTLATLDGERTPVEWDAAAFPYLVTAVWDEDLLIVVQSRDQKTMRVIMNGEVIREDTDPHWVDIVPGVPAQLADGRIVWTQTSEDTRRLIIGLPAELGAAKPVTPAGLQVREILGTDGDTVLFTASTEPTQIALWSYGAGGLTEVSGRPGVHTGRRAGGTTVVSSRYLDEDGAHVRINSTAIDSLAQRPNLPSPQPVIFGAGPSGIRTAVLFPSSHRPGSARLPVLLDPYGGPHAQRVLKARGAYLTSQWFAEQGFAVVVADGRGTGGRGPGWDRAVAGDLAAPVLEDQVTALQAAAGRFGDLDTGRVAIRGWSFGGYLAALAVLRRPDVFHAAIAGAPVTDWRLYDTHYTERYLGDPGSSVTVYDRCSLIEDAERAVVPAGGSGEPSGAGRVFRPLLVIHGLADDNVVAAHTLRLSSALLAAGYPHSVLPLSGVTHMTPQEVVAENLLLLQAGFLRDALSRE